MRHSTLYLLGLWDGQPRFFEGLAVLPWLLVIELLPVLTIPAERAGQWTKQQRTLGRVQFAEVTRDDAVVLESIKRALSLVVGKHAVLPVPGKGSHVGIVGAGEPAPVLLRCIGQRT